MTYVCPFVRSVDRLFICILHQKLHLRNFNMVLLGTFRVCV